jgi:very-short-patch-repair endonuclease
MTAFFNRASEREKRRQLRRAMPEPEVLLWLRLKGRQLLGCKFRRQYSVGPYLLDFYTPEAQLGIELDGDSHFQPRHSAMTSGVNISSNFRDQSVEIS